MGKLPEHPLRRILSRIVRDTGGSQSFLIEYVHRGAPDDKIAVNGSEVARVAKGSFTLIDGETQIPFHRILFIRDVRSGSILWEKRMPTKASDRDLGC